MKTRKLGGKPEIFAIELGYMGLSHGYGPPVAPTAALLVQAHAGR